MKKLIFVLLFVLLCGCAKKSEVIRIIVDKRFIQDTPIIMVCEKVDGHIQSETCSWCYEDFTSAPMEYNPNYQVPLFSNPLGIRLV